MPVILAAFGEGAFVGRIGIRIEHAGISAVAGDAVALEVGHMFGQRGRAEPGAELPNDARLHHHAPGIRPQLDGDRSSPAAAEPGAAPALA